MPGCLGCLGQNWRRAWSVHDPSLLGHVEEALELQRQSFSFLAHLIEKLPLHVLRGDLLRFPSKAITLIDCFVQGLAIPITRPVHME